MKRILLIFALTTSLVASSQTQTFTGVKTFTSPPKFQNLIQNDLNTKVLTVNSTGVLQWKNASSFTAPTLQEILSPGGATVTLPINFKDSGTTYYSAHNNLENHSNSQLSLLNSSDSPTEFLMIDRFKLTISNLGCASYNHFTGTGIKYETNSSNLINIDLSGTYSTARIIKPIDASGKIAVINDNAPLSATDIGVVGEIRVTSTYIYTCTASNTWVRAAMATW